MRYGKRTIASRAVYHNAIQTVKQTHFFTAVTVQLCCHLREWHCGFTAIHLSCSGVVFLIFNATFDISGSDRWSPSRSDGFLVHTTLNFPQAFLLFSAGVSAGALNAVAGGGSFISFPALLLIHVPPVQANATNTVALWPGLAASAVAYVRRLNVPLRLLFPLLVTSVIGGWMGALLLLKTPQHTFQHLVPWLLLGGTLLFTFGNRLRAVAGKKHNVGDLRELSWLAITAASFAEFAVAIYGGYFGAGIGFISLAMLAALGMHDIHAMGAIRTLLAVAINAAAVVTFIVEHAVLWTQCLEMIAGALLGGWLAAHYAQKADPVRLRYLVIATGFAMSVYFFARLR